MDKVGASATYAGSATAIAPGLIWGWSQSEWLIFTSLMGLLFGAIGIAIQVWVGYHKVKALQAEESSWRFKQVKE